MGENAKTSREIDGIQVGESCCVGPERPEVSSILFSSHTAGPANWISYFAIAEHEPATVADRPRLRLVTFATTLPIANSSMRPANSPSRSKKLAPRIELLAAQLGDPAKAKSAVAELAMLAACSETARRSMLAHKVESRVVALLGASATEPQMQCWGLSVLSNLAVGNGRPAGGPPLRERQLSAVPVLAALVSSRNPEVQHAAALHLATLSHSAVMRRAIAQAPSEPLASLYQLEDPTSLAESAPSPYARRLRDEALDYARLALRTSQGRNYKPAFEPTSYHALKAQEVKSATAVQGQARRRQAQLSYESTRVARTSQVRTWPPIESMPILRRAVPRKGDLFFKQTGS